MRSLIIFLTIWYAFLMQGCQTVNPKAEAAVDWVAERSGLLQNGVAAAVRLGIFHLEEGSDKERGIEIANVVSSNLESLIENGTTDPTSIRSAFRINEPYYDKLFESIGELVHAELGKVGSKYGAEAELEILRAVLAGIRDGTAQK